MTLGEKKNEGYKEVLVEDVIAPEGRQRLEISEEEIVELAETIHEWGLRQAIEVVPRGEKYEIVYGERRWLAHKKLGKEKIWVRIVDLNKQEIILVRAMENISRSNLSAVEEAATFGEMRDEFKLSTEQIAKKVGVRVGTVKRRLDILRMPAEFQKAIHKKLVSNTVAEELWRCPSESHRLYLLDLAIDHGITAAIARTWVDDYNKSQRKSEDVNYKGRGGHHPMEIKPIYQACDICSEAVEINDAVHLGICKICSKKIRDATEE